MALLDTTTPEPADRSGAREPAPVALHVTASPEAAAAVTVASSSAAGVAIPRLAAGAALAPAPASREPGQRSAFSCGSCGYGAYFRGPVARACPMCRHYAWVAPPVVRGGLDLL